MVAVAGLLRRVAPLQIKALLVAVLPPSRTNVSRIQSLGLMFRVCGLGEGIATVLSVRFNNVNVTTLNNVNRHPHVMDRLK